MNERNAHLTFKVNDKSGQGINSTCCLAIGRIFDMRAITEKNKLRWYVAVEYS